MGPWSHSSWEAMVIFLSVEVCWWERGEKAMRKRRQRRGFIYGWGACDFVSRHIPVGDTSSRHANTAAAPGVCRRLWRAIESRSESGYCPRTGSRGPQHAHSLSCGLLFVTWQHLSTGCYQPSPFPNALPYALTALRLSCGASLPPPAVWLCHSGGPCAPCFHTCP
jgi:hypothetical protein